MTRSRRTLHPLHRAWQALPAQSRRLWLARCSSLLAPSASREPPATCSEIVIGGEIDRASGLGEGARVMGRALDALGVRRQMVAAGLRLPGSARGGAGGAQGAWDKDAALVLHVNAPELPLALIGLGRKAIRGRRIVGYWAWELPVVPDTWRLAARHVHEVWVPSRFTADAIEGIMPGRVRVVPHALAAAPPVPSGLGRADFGLPDDALVVLCSFSLASSLVRKNPLAAIAAFRQAFGDRPDRLLLLKVGHSEHYQDDLTQIRQAIAGASNIRLESRILPEGDLHALTQASDIVLSLHRSEGFGLVPAQAMQLGKVVVATDWSATAEFLDDGCGVPVPYRLIPAADPRGVYQAPGAVWADAEVGAAAAALRNLAEQPERRRTLGAAAQDVAARRFGVDFLAQAVAAIGVRGL